MKRFCLLSLSLALLPACSGDDTSPSGATDASTTDVSVEDTGSPEDGGSPVDTGSPKADTGAPTDAGDAAVEELDAGDGGDGSLGPCPSSWFVAPVTDPSIALPDGGGGVLLHAIGTGTQNYVCKATTPDGGATTYAWTLVTPQANLLDCHNAIIGQHFASEAGAGFPEWQTSDGFVIGVKKAPFTPDGGSGSIPWLLVTAVDGGGSGPLSMTDYIQRLNTDGGNAPSTGCGVDGGVGDTIDVGYTADYYFYGP